MRPHREGPANGPELVEAFAGAGRTARSSGMRFLRFDGQQLRWKKQRRSKDINRHDPINRRISVFGRLRSSQDQGVRSGEIESGTGAPHSTTLRGFESAFEFAASSWSAVLLCNWLHCED